MHRHSAPVVKVGLLAVLVVSACDQGSAVDSCDHYCEYRVCYYREDGTSPVAEGLETWFFEWSVNEDHPTGDDLPGSFRYMHPAAFEYQAGVVASPYGEACIMNYHCWGGRRAVWAKTRGFAPVVTFPVGCGDKVHQQIEAITEAEDGTQLCAWPPEESPCDAQVKVVGPDGVTAPRVVWWVRAIEPAPIEDGVWGLLGNGAEYSGDDIRWPVSTLLVYSVGHVPKISCLQCGEQTIQLEASPFVWKPSGGCTAAPGPGGANGPRSLAWLLLVTVGHLARGRPRGRDR